MTFSAAILAGGHSRRLGGRDKSGLRIGGHTILDRQLTELSRVADEILLVGTDQRPVGHPAVRAVRDRVPGCGPLGGLHTALSEASFETTLVVACDMPYVTAPLMAHMLALTREVDAVVPRTDRGYHPLCAVFTRACAGVVARHIAERRLKMTDLLEALNVHLVTERDIRAFGDPEHLLANVNTTTELFRCGAPLGNEL